MTVHASIDIAAPRERVWDFLMSPVTSALLDPHFIKTFPVPGTPEGVGQQWCVMLQAEEGGIELHLQEIVDIQPPQRLVTKVLSIPVPFLKASTLDATDTGCTYTVRYGVHVIGGLASETSRNLERAMRDDMARVKAIVESGVEWSTPRDPGPEEGHRA
jgi:hypothetical protein